MKKLQNWRHHYAVQSFLAPIPIVGACFFETNHKRALYGAAKQATVLFGGSFFMALDLITVNLLTHNLTNSTPVNALEQRYINAVPNMAFGMFASALIFNATAEAIKRCNKCNQKNNKKSDENGNQSLLGNT